MTPFPHLAAIAASNLSPALPLPLAVGRRVRLAAQTGSPCNGTTFTCSGSTGGTPLSGLGQRMIQILDWLVAVTIIICLVNIVIAAFLYVNSESNMEGRDQAQARLTNSIIGIALILAAYELVWFAVQFLSQKYFTL